jgi:peptidoglycan hydrolase-like amidase
MSAPRPLKVILKRGSNRLSLLFGLTIISVLILAGVYFTHNSAQAASTLTADVRGQVADKQTGQPIAGAAINASDLGLFAVSDQTGRFTWNDIPLAQTILPISITVSATGYGDWTIHDVRLLSKDTLILSIALSQNPTTIVMPPPRAELPDWPDETMGGAVLDTPTEDQSDLPLPDTIRVRITGYAYCDLDRPYTVETIDFKDYVKHVLPNEWSASWPTESLRSGAMAAKMYAWSYIAVGGKWPDADVYDSTCDQVYNPAVEYQSTNDAVDFTWNWRLMRGDQLVRTFYRHDSSQCPLGIVGNCMGQVDSRDMAYDGYTWDEILLFFYSDSALSEVDPPPGGYSLRYYGMYNDDENRVKIRVDDPTNDDPGPPVDVGAQDLTIEWWMKALLVENSAAAVGCGANQSWRQGNILLDRDRFNQDRKFGVSLAGGKAVFGVSGDGTGDLTICGSSNLADGEWHHVVVQRQRSDGWLWLFVDGSLEAQADGPDGDISYPDDGIPGSFCGPGGDQPCTNSDPFLVLGAEKHEIGPSNPSFSGWIDELRLSNTLRYSGSFAPPVDPFTADGDTVALYHFDEGIGNAINDVSGYPGGPSNGLRIYGGVINGPEWTTDTVWYASSSTPTPTPTPTTTSTPTSTPTPTNTATPTPTSTATPTPTSTPTATGSPTATLSSNETPTPTHTPTATGSTTPDTPTPTATTNSQSGDVNKDGKVNVLDVQLCVNVFLGTETDPETVSLSDVNADGQVNVLDVQQIANIVLLG